MWDSSDTYAHYKINQIEASQSSPLKSLASSLVLIIQYMPKVGLIRHPDTSHNQSNWSITITPT